MDNGIDETFMKAVKTAGTKIILRRELSRNIKEKPMLMPDADTLI